MKNMSPRQQKFAEIIRGAVAKRLASGQLKHASFIDRPLTITHVWINTDFSHGKIFFSCTADEETIDTITNALNAEAPFLQSSLRRNLKTKYAPHLEFFYDSDQDYAEHMDEVLDRIKAG